jgi:hypothetical protein
MKSKLLLTSALASSVILAGSAFAETKISGTLEQTYVAASGKTSTDGGLASQDGIGSQTTISISKTADLDNGMSLKAGYVYENDGSTMYSDTEYLEITSGAVMFRLGQDGGHAATGNMVPFVGDSAETAAQGETYLNNGITSIIDEVHEAPNVSLSVSLPYKTTATVRYAPNGDQGAKGGDSSYGPSTEVGSGQEAVITSSPIEGLTVQVGYQKVANANDNNIVTTDTGSNSYSMYGFNYNFGNVKIGYNHQKANDGTSSSVAGGNDVETNQYGVTFAVNDNMSIGLHTGKAETVNNSSDRDEKIQGIGVGYNLGGLGIEITYNEVEAVTSGSDTDTLQIRTVQKF